MGRQHSREGERCRFGGVSEGFKELVSEQGQATVYFLETRLHREPCSPVTTFKGGASGGGAAAIETAGLSEAAAGVGPAGTGMGSRDEICSAP